MICYPADVTEIEVSVINDYWLVSDVSSTEFQYTIKQIDNYYKPENVRPASFLAKNSTFISTLPAFTCQDCNRKIPAKNRTDYTSRAKNNKEALCAECLDSRQKRLIDDAHQTLNEYKGEKFKPTDYLNNLTIQECLLLLSISSEQTDNDHFLGESLEEISITGMKSNDEIFLLWLIGKKALVQIHELPLDVAQANNVIYGEFEHITYDSRYRNPARYRYKESITPGVYLIPPALDGHQEGSDISSLLYQKLQSSTISINDVEKLRQIIKEMQLGKLYELVLETGKEYKIPINNSNVLRALLNHLAENYPPQKVYFTFRVMARKTIEYMHKESAPSYIAQNYFAKFTGDYIQFIENKGFELEKAWTLPPHIQTSPFEALFSQLYLNNHFDWNKLSTKEVIALWLENVRLSEDAQDLLT